MDTLIKRKEIAAGLTAQLRITNLMELNIGCVLQAVSQHRASLKNPPFSADDYLDCLLKQKLPETVARLTPFKLLFMILKKNSFHMLE